MEEMKMKLKNLKNIFAIIAILLLVPVLASAQNSPVIRMSIANYDPLPVQPGEFVDVWVSVQNIGAGDARNIRIEYLSSPYFDLVNPEDEVREIPVIGSNNDYLLKYRFKVADDVVEGDNQLRFQHSLRSAPGVVTTVNLRLDVKSTDVPISISSVRLSPDPVEPGQRSELTIAVTNPAVASNLRDVSVSLQLVNQQGNSMFDLPFAPIDSTNTKSINRILPGQTTEFRFSLVTYPDADSKIYKVPVLISYFDDVGRRYDDLSFISVNVNSEPDLFIVIESTTLNSRNRQGDIVFDVINQGVSNVKLLTVSLDNSDLFNIESTSNKNYLGNIESDDFKSARYRVSVNDDVDEVSFPVTLTFRDALNNEFTQSFEVVHTLRNPETNGGGLGTFIIVLLVVGIIVFIFYRQKAKRKRMQRHDDDD
jgi:hypothetical protein